MLSDNDIRFIWENSADSPGVVSDYLQERCDVVGVGFSLTSFARKPKIYAPPVEGELFVFIDFSNAERPTFIDVGPIVSTNHFIHEKKCVHINRTHFISLMQDVHNPRIVEFREGEGDFFFGCE